MRSSEGNIFKPIAQKHINDTTLCYLNDFRLENVSMNAFPFAFDSSNHSIRLYMKNETYD